MLFRAIVVAATALMVTAGPSRAGEQTFPSECTLRDVEIVTQLEQRGEAQDVPGEILYEAFWTMKRARDACYEGRVSAAMALYDSIFKTSLAGRTQMR